jgi:signal transduction histidine kinase
MRSDWMRAWASVRRALEWDGRAASVKREAEAESFEDLLRRNARAVARARVLLALGNILVLYLDPNTPPSADWDRLALAYGTALLIIAYSFWVWRQETSRTPPGYLPRLTVWLDVLFSAALIASTGAHTSPFYMWNVFTIVGSALQNGWRTAVRVAGAQIALYFAICVPYHGRPDFELDTFVTRTTYLFVIALVLAHMGQRLLEQNRMLAGLHTAATHMTTGRSTREILGRIADTLTDLLEVDQVLVAGWEEGEAAPQPVQVNMDRAQGEHLLHVARQLLASPLQASRPSTIVSNAVQTDPRFHTARQALAGVRNVLILRLPGTRDSPGLLIACNRLSERTFTPADRELAELLAAQAGPLLEACRLQEQRRYSASVDERRRIAAELHDRLIQTLASLDLRILTCSDLWRDQRWEPLGGELRMLKRLAEEALAEARDAISELAPVRLREEGLTVYLEDCIRRFQERSFTPVEAAIQVAVADAPEPTALLLIGLLREGLNNNRKHAQANRVTLKVAQHGDQIHFLLADEGVGFCPERSGLPQPPTRHYGLAYLRERITAVGGEMQVTSRLGEGSVLEARVPILTEERLTSLLSQRPG